MTDPNEGIGQLVEKLDALLRRQDSFSKEIEELRRAIDRLKAKEVPGPQAAGPSIEPAAMIREPEVVPAASAQEPIVEPARPVPQWQPAQPPGRLASLKEDYSKKAKSDFEKFVGENLLNKIGIVITIIGVAIGAKYSIEHQLINPLTRIILGYLVGLGLLGFGIKFKEKYEGYSAVLVSGAIAILYFITYAAYGFYNLIPQALAFLLMVAYTVFAVLSAIHYNRQVIAHIGLVGAYAVPFLLSDGSGKVAVLFSYMAIINVGILWISFKKDWKSLFHVSFFLTWLMFSVWYIADYRSSEHFGLGLGFLCVFFATFYAMFLARQLLREEKFETVGIVLLLANAFVFYGLGYAMLNGHATGNHLLGLFTLGNAALHFGVSFVVNRRKLSDRHLFFLVVGLVLVFVTMAIPVQLDGNWVTLLWAGEAALLFWIGRRHQMPIYEKLAYPLMFIAFFSIMHDWSGMIGAYFPDQPETRVSPLLNINFLSSLLFVASFAFILHLNRNRDDDPPLFGSKQLNSVLQVSVPVILLIAAYCTFSMEITTYWDQQYADSLRTVQVAGQEYADSYWNYDLVNYKIVWTINYALLFFAALSFANIKWWRNRALGFVNMGFGAFVLLAFLGQGLFALSALRGTYLSQEQSEYYHRGIFNIGIRYVSFAFVGLMLASIYRYMRQDFLKPQPFNFQLGFDLLLHGSLLWLASSELLAWMDMAGSSESNKLGLSILWGVYALLLIALGIWKNKGHLRIGAIGLFGVTLVKLFFYDLSKLDTIAKTIVFVSLGVLLLIISFLYNKYKDIIFDGDKN